MKIETLAIHSGNHTDKSTGAIAVPIILSTTFERDAQGDFVEGRDKYSRWSNPNRNAVEQKIAALEGGKEALCFASGQASTMCVIHAMGENSHIIIPNDRYHGTLDLIEKHYETWGLTFTEVEMTNLAEVKAAIRPNTKLICMETPSNPLLKVSDIRSIVKIAKEKNILTLCDNTFATPFFQQPLAMGVDVVMHSSSKYFGGHSDILGGVIIVGETNEMYRKFRSFQGLSGAVPSGFDTWLLNRSLSTFAIRMPVHARNAMLLAEFLEKQVEFIDDVFYPGLPTNQFHELAKQQMKGGFGGMMSILVKGGKNEAMKLASSLKIFKHATSLGGVESLLEHRRTAEDEHPQSPENLLRISVGIEHIDDLIADFKQAFASL